jgi:hypothetical protein
MRTMNRREMLRLLAAAGSLLRLGAAAGCRGSRGGDMMGGGMMGAATAGDMSTYMELFARHTELRRRVEEIPGGVRTATESDAPALVAQLQAHVASMYRRMTTTPSGVVVTETSSDPELIRTIRGHAREVSGFVERGMPAMMESMMR